MICDNWRSAGVVAEARARDLGYAWRDGSVRSEGLSGTGFSGLKVDPCSVRRGCRRGRCLAGAAGKAFCRTRDMGVGRDRGPGGRW